jgi:hypothetical protein
LIVGLTSLLVCVGVLEQKRKAQEKDNEVIPEEDVDLFLGNSSGHVARAPPRKRAKKSSQQSSRAA